MGSREVQRASAALARADGAKNGEIEVSCTGNLLVRLWCTMVEAMYFGNNIFPVQILDIQFREA